MSGNRWAWIAGACCKTSAPLEKVPVPGEVRATNPFPLILNTPQPNNEYGPIYRLSYIYIYIYIGYLLLGGWEVNKYLDPKSM